MRICDRWMPEGTTDRRDGSHTLQCTTSRKERQIVRMAVTDHSVTSRTVAQHIEFVTHHSVSARTIRCHVQQSGLSIELLPWPAFSPDLSLIENIWSMLAQRLPHITPPAATPDQLWQRVEAAWSDVPKEHIQSLFE
ncbi:HTH_Tnp_Tc3_2 domain-containing protein [Trichonephila clavipes]|nr:HTH_Tnp_Tc3_2 domain-containing protein [Trichonephila clavipes]